jgi:uncharacterized protein YdeI (YjbR/CyaY-like superfamily)
VSSRGWIDQENKSQYIPGHDRPPSAQVIDLKNFVSSNPHMSRKNPKVDAYIRQDRKWRKESEKLRMISLGCGLTEELKWGKPCYTFQESNVVIIQPFKEYCALMFCNGALLKDPKGILKRIGEHTQAARQARFTNVQQIAEEEPTLRAYIYEAVEGEKAGLKVVLNKNPLPIPKELQRKLDDTPALKAAFKALTPGRQKGYIFYFSAAKQSKTRESRIEKCRQRILGGKGLND